MCCEYCKQFRGWCKSFTRIETLLSILESVLLLILITFLIFIILHLLACTKETRLSENHPTVAIKSSKVDLEVPPTSSSIQTVSPRVMCTWDLLKTTLSLTHYYEVDQGYTITEYNTQSLIIHPTYTSPIASGFNNLSYINNTSDWSDGVDVNENKFILALVNVSPSQDVTFGCILTIITEYWVLTAASCIEKINSLNSIVMKSYRESKQERLHTVDHISIHPMYRRTNKSYDLAALKSEDSLIRKGVSMLILPTMLDNLLITLGEKLMIFGYGRHSPTELSLRRVNVYVLPRSRCAEARKDGHCGPRVLCTSALRGQRQSCMYCAGAPLLSPGGRLLGIRSYTRQCGEPALYVNLAYFREWIEEILRTN